jgi:hypothetical protein
MLLQGCPLDDHQLQQQQGAVQQALQQQVPQQQQPRVVKRAKRVTFRDEMPPSVAPTAAAAAAAAEAGQALAQVGPAPGGRAEGMSAAGLHCCWCDAAEYACHGQLPSLPTATSSCGICCS